MREKTSKRSMGENSRGKMKNSTPKVSRSRDGVVSRSRDGVREKPATKTKTSERPRNETKKLNDQLKVFKEMLIQKKSSLTHYLKTELSELEAADKHHLADLEEMASDTHDTDSVCEIMAVGASTIDQIDQALAKIEEGTYGTCEDCGDQIAFERLEALPFATLCVECKKRREVLRS
jgi:DnaK suppressor protein